MDLSKARKTLIEARDKMAYLAEAVEAMDAIIANKAYLAIAENIKRERKGNEEFLVEVRARVAGLNNELATKRKKVSEANEYLNDGYKTKEKEIDKALEVYEDTKKLEIDEGLNNSRKELMSVRSEVAEARAELDTTTGKLSDLQAEIAEMLAN